MRAASGTYEFWDHAADVGIRIDAPTFEDLFITAGIALMEWIGPAPVGTATFVDLVSIDGEDSEGLLVRWLQELLFRFHQRHAYFLQVESIEAVEKSLTARVLSARWDESSSRDFQEVKAITYHQLLVRPYDGGWTASVILDI
jgi:SHS2 domain-containing protein